MSCTKHTSFSTNERSIDLNDECSSVGLNRDDRDDDDRACDAIDGAWRPSRRRLDTNIMADMTDTHRQSAESAVSERAEFGIELPALSIESRSGRGISQEQT